MKRKAHSMFYIVKMNEIFLNHMLQDPWDKYMRFRVFDGFFKGFKSIHRSSLSH